jgi:uncharacterized membrane protein YbhN (UPF0104 family)
VVGGFLDAVHAFFAHLGAVQWDVLGLALLCHLGKVLCLARAWRNVIAAAYPDERVRQRSVLGAYVAGVAVNAIVPARAGDLLKLYLVRHRVESSSYTTLAATLGVLSIFNLAATSVLLVWAVHKGVLPGLDVLPSLPTFDFGWALDYPRLTFAVGIALVVALAAATIWAYSHYARFKQRVAQGFAVLGNKRRYVRTVLTWQVLEWSFRIAALYFFLRAFDIVADLDNAVLVQVAQSLSALVPVTPGGIGTEQALLVYLFAGSAGATAVLSFSVGMRIVVTLVNLLLGFAAIGLMLRTFRWRRRMDAAAEAS